MKRNSRIILVSIAGLVFLLFVFFYFGYPQEIVVEGWKLKPEGMQEPGTSPFSGSRIYTFNIRTQSFTPISPADRDAYKPVWSPNGKRLAYLYIQNEERAGIAILNQVQQTDFFDFPSHISNFDFELAWSPDSTSILFLNNIEDCHIFYQLDLDNESITETSNFPKLCGETTPHLAWSSEGSIVAEINRTIYAVDTVTHELRFITEGHEPFWHPNGRQLMYICQIHDKGFNGLCETTFDGQNKHVLIQQFFGFHNPSWTSGTKYIGFLNSTGAEGDLSYLTLINMRTRMHRNIYQITGRGRREIWIEGVAWRP